MDALPDALARDVADALRRVGDFGTVTIRVRNGAVVGVDELRQRSIADERFQLPLRGMPEPD